MGYTPPASIDIGTEAIDRATYGAAEYTRVDRQNFANLSGKITLIKIYTAVAMTGVEVATFFVVSGNNLSTRDTEVIGNVALGYSEHAVSLDVVAGDSIGLYFATGQVEIDANVSDGYWYKNSDEIPCENVGFTVGTNVIMSFYGSGDTGEGELTIGDSFSVVDSLVKNVTKQLAEAFSAIDSWVARISFNEAFSIADSFIRSAVKGLTEAFQTVDSFASTVFLYLYEAFSITDSFKRFFKNLYGKVSKFISTYTKRNKDTSTYTKRDKGRSDYTKRDKERGEEL